MLCQAVIHVLRNVFGAFACGLQRASAWSRWDERAPISRRKSVAPSFLNRTPPPSRWVPYTSARIGAAKKGVKLGNVCYDCGAMKEKAMYTTREAATMLSVCMKTLRDYITAGKLRAVRRGGGQYLIHENDLRVFLGLDADDALTRMLHDDL